MREDFSNITIPDEVGSPNGFIGPYTTQMLAYGQCPLIKRSMEKKDYGFRIYRNRVKHVSILRV